MRREERLTSNDQTSASNFQHDVSSSRHAELLTEGRAKYQHLLLPSISCSVDEQTFCLKPKDLHLTVTEEQSNQSCYMFKSNISMNVGSVLQTAETLKH